jgi:hypothetical protein
MLIFSNCICIANLLDPRVYKLFFILTWTITFIEYSYAGVFHTNSLFWIFLQFGEPVDVHVSQFIMIERKLATCMALLW